MGGIWAIGIQPSPLNYSCRKWGSLSDVSLERRPFPTKAYAAATVRVVRRLTAAAALPFVCMLLREWSGMIRKPGLTPNKTNSLQEQ